MSDSQRFGFVFTSSSTTWDICQPIWLVNHNSTQIEGLLMNLLVIFVYTFRVAPRVFDVFFQTVGEGWTPSSRLNSLRAVVWKKGTDTFSMQIGYRMVKLVKAVYMSLVSVLMLFVLFLQEGVLNIILNCLAIEFIWVIDVEHAKSPYWDQKRRWIKAAAVECRLRASLELLALRNPHLLCEKYEINIEKYKEAFGGKLVSLENPKQARFDADDERFMSETDTVWKWASEIAKEERNQNAIWQFSDNIVAFGCFDIFLTKLGLASSTSYGIFRRFAPLRTWSYWETVLFLPPVPGSEDKITPVPLQEAHTALGDSQ